VSENLLLGLLWWAWRDAAITDAALAAALQRVADGAWQHLPEVGARAPTVGSLVLRMLAGLGGAAQASVAARGQGKGRARQLERAAERALEEPLARGPGVGAPPAAR
jgi:hypothetical protein